MELVTPGIGLIFWMTLSFGLLLFVLTKFAWRPIMSMLREREQSIEEALHEADKARDEMKQLQAHNIELLN
ncbi:MAG: F0F1 ATP synthase subunit B, partial [Bacteroidetes bacterium HGW-Bacteroidetes-22]